MQNENGIVIRWLNPAAGDRMAMKRERAAMLRAAPWCRRFPRIDGFVLDVVRRAGG